ncbi:MAG: helix-turn-helix domain-containing protein [Chloroflexota bacterium]
MDDQRVGAVIRALRLRRGWRQIDLAVAAGVSTASISRAERGHISEMAVEMVRGIAAALDLRLDLTPRWRGGDLDRLISDRHARMHGVAGPLLRQHGWQCWPEVSFAVFGERGVVDLLGWHPGRCSVLVVELKTEIVDANELVGTMDRKRRLAIGIARDRGLDPVRVGSLLFVAGSATNRRRVARYDALLRSALPLRGASMSRWLRNPSVEGHGLLFLADDHPGNVIQGLATRKRVRHRSNGPIRAADWTRRAR